MDELGSRRETQYVRTILAEGTSADRQLRVFRETGDLRASEKAFTQAVAIRDDGRTWFNLGVVRARLNDSPGALDAFEHAAQHTDTKDQAQKEIARIKGAPKSATPDRMPVERIPGTGQGYTK